MCSRLQHVRSKSLIRECPSTPSFPGSLKTWYLPFIAGENPTASRAEWVESSLLSFTSEVVEEQHCLGLVPAGSQLSPEHVSWSIKSINNKITVHGKRAASERQKKLKRFWWAAMIVFPISGHCWLCCPKFSLSPAQNSWDVHERLGGRREWKGVMPKSKTWLCDSMCRPSPLWLWVRPWPTLPEWCGHHQCSRWSVKELIGLFEVSTLTWWQCFKV